MFFPIGDDNTRREREPVVVWVLLAINVTVWGLQLLFGPRFTYAFSAVPFEILNGTDLIRPVLMSVTGGGSIEIPHFPGPSPIQLTLLTSMFMHGSWMHILGNMIYLMIFGDQIEDLLGRARFLLFYLSCGFAASLAHIAVDADSMVPSLGASGAIAGVLGAYLIRYPTNRVFVLLLFAAVPLPAFIVLGGWILLQVVGQVSLVGAQGGGVAYMAHIGGFVTGVLLILVLRPAPRPPSRPRWTPPAPLGATRA